MFYFATQLNSRNTLGGDIADNGGLHESFHAFQNQVAKSGAPPTLAHLPMFTSEQLFFISYANVSVAITCLGYFSNHVIKGGRFPFRNIFSMEKTSQIPSSPSSYMRAQSLFQVFKQATNLLPFLCRPIAVWFDPKR